MASYFKVNNFPCALQQGYGLTQRLSTERDVVNRLDFISFTDCSGSASIIEFNKF